MSSTLRNPGPIEDYMKTKHAANRIARVDSQEKQNHGELFGVIPKKGQPGKWCLIMDLSFPPGNSVNNRIDRNLCSMHYVSVDTAVQ